MKWKVLCFLLCVPFCLFSLSLSSSAAGDDTILYGMTHEQMLQFGYEYENGVYTLPSGIIPPEAYFPATMLIEEPRFPDIDPRKIPWSTAPSYIQDIVYMGIEGAATTDVDDYKMPFVAVRVNANNIRVFVGLNCGLGVISNTNNVRICSPNSSVYDFVPKSYYCYVATFSHSYQLISDWSKCEPVEWGSERVLTYNTSSFFTPSNNVDLYLYGGNGVRVGNDTGLGIPLYPEADSTTVYFVFNNTIGFNSGFYFSNQSFYYPGVYVQTFTPPTPEEVEQETQKGIFETLKSIPDTIAEKFKGLFIPEEGYFDTYIQEYQDYFKDRFGILYELPGASLDILQQFIDFEPITEGYYIPIPEVVLPVRLEDGTYENFVILEEQNYVFDFLSEGAFGTLYEFYRSFVWLIFVLGLISLAVRKYNKITGGDGQ